MAKSKIRKKSLGLIFPQESPNEKVPKISHSVADAKFPIVGNSITRLDIYNELWVVLSGSLSRRFENHDKYRFPGLSTASTVYHQILSLTEIAAFALSEKKPSGLASETKHIGGSGEGQANKNDPFYMELKRMQNQLQEMRPPEDLMRFYQSFDRRFEDLKLSLKSIMDEYANLKKRKTFFSNNVIDAIHDLRMNPDGLSDAEIRCLIEITLEHFEKKNFQIFNDMNSIAPLFAIFIDQSVRFEDGKTVRYKSSDTEKTTIRKHEYELIEKKLSPK